MNPVELFVRRYLVDEPYRRLPDDDLWARFRDRGDEAAFRVFLERSGGRIYHFCRALVRNDSLCDEVFQESLLTLARNRVEVYVPPYVDPATQEFRGTDGDLRATVVQDVGSGLSSGAVGVGFDDLPATGLAPGELTKIFLQRNLERIEQALKEYQEFGAKVGSYWVPTYEMSKTVDELRTSVAERVAEISAVQAGESTSLQVGGPSGPVLSVASLNNTDRILAGQMPGYPSGGGRPKRRRLRGGGQDGRSDDRFDR